MSFQHIEVEQGTPEWFAARIAIPTASMMDAVMASGRGGGDSKTRAKYMRQIVGERITGEKDPSFRSTPAMERGNAMEPEARSMFEFMSDLTVTPCGFYRSDEFRFGASPDGLVGEDGTLEIKTKQPDLLIEWLQIGSFPIEHRKQVQAQLWATGRKVCHFVGYWPKMPLFYVVVERDDAFIEEIKNAIATFNEETDTMESNLRGMFK